MQTTCSSPILSQQPRLIPADTTSPTKTHSCIASPEPLPVRNHILSPSTYQQLFPDKPEYVISGGKARPRASSSIRKRKGFHPHTPSSVVPVQAAGPILIPRRLCGTVVGKSRSGNTNSMPSALLPEWSHPFA